MHDNLPQHHRQITLNDANAMGLCSTCNSMENCIRRRNWRGPVLFCEEFDDTVVVEVHRSAAVKKAPVKDVIPVTEAQSYRGLCVNCAHRDRCCFAKADGGVWHCEEYA